jgi:hypothetical protein
MTTIMVRIVEAVPHHRCSEGAGVALDLRLIGPANLYRHGPAQLHAGQEGHPAAQVPSGTMFSTLPICGKDFALLRFCSALAAFLRDGHDNSPAEQNIAARLVGHQS